MNQEDKPQPGVSLIADFDGDIAELLSTEIPQTLPLLPVRNMMLFPGVLSSVMVSRESSLAVVKRAAKDNSLFAVATQKDAGVEQPGEGDLYPIAVAARVMRVLELPGGITSVILQSFGRCKVGKITRRTPVTRINVSSLPDVLPPTDSKEYAALVDECRDAAIRFLKLGDTQHEEAVFAIRNIKHDVFTINFLCTNLPFTLEEKANLLAIDDNVERAYALLTLLNRACQFATLKRDIQNQTREELDQQQKEYFLQQQIKSIQNELGENQNKDAQELREKLAKKNLSEKMRTLLDKEIDKLNRISPQNPDYNVQLNYLETIATLPWGELTKDKLNIKTARRVLDQNHFGMERVKERILEYLASLLYRGDRRAPILCLYGPPGVGKTSLGRSIAEAIGRKYVRMSLGGIHDEAEIRGHRRTYIGAMPGRIVKSLIKAGTDNPVFVLDEIDKVTDSNINGDPQSALLEVLDPEQNSAFHDNFLDLDYNLSNVFFIATANSLQTIPAPLLDRMEVIEVEGYLTEEKKEIARRHLIPREAANYNEDFARSLKFSPESIEHIIEKYTRESGVRQLEKQIGKIYRKIALERSMQSEEEAAQGVQKLKPADIGRLLGKPIYCRDKYQGNDYAGVVTGLAWTAVGGEILFIETSVSRSKAAKLTLTGNLGDVMKESAVLALEYIRAHAAGLGIDYRVFDHWGLHVHVPEGATPKDGPSAGITIATSIASALTQRKVKAGIAMTGEITLRGRVLPVGGIKEKILAAKRAGITEIIISEDNRKDIDDIAEQYLKGLTFHFVKDVDEVLGIALLDEQPKNAIELTIEDDDAPAAGNAQDNHSGKAVAARLLKP